MSSDELLAALQGCLGSALLQQQVAGGAATVVIGRERALEVFGTLRQEPRFGFDLLVDVTAVDFLGRAPRFEVVYHLYSLAHRHRLRVKIPVAEDDCRVPSVTPIWKGANWLEREVWDMFGVRFDGHPDLRRILMYESFEGYPLRKDYPVSKRQPLVPERDPVDDPWGLR